MPSQVYRDLLEVMKERGGPYAGLDVPEFYELAETIFEPQEAEINNVLTRKPVSVDEITAKTARDIEISLDLILIGNFQENSDVPISSGVFSSGRIPAR